MTRTATQATLPSEELASPPAAPILAAMDIAIEAMLIGLVAFAPFAFGAVEAWSELIVFVGSVLILACLGVRFLLCRSTKPIWTWAYVPLVLFLLLAGAQLLSLPAKWVASVSPHTALLKSDLLSDLPDAPNVLSRLTLSFYPLATRHDLVVVLAMSAVFIASLNVYCRGVQLKRLLWSIAIIAALVGLLALAQDLTGAKRVYWIGPPGRGAATAGPFIHYSHFGQFMNLGCGAILALLLLSLHSVFKQKGFDAVRLLRGWRGDEFRVTWVLVGLIVLAVVTIFLSMSRGAMVALFVAFAFATLSLSRVKGLPGRGWVLIPLVLALFGGLFLGFDATFNRLATLTGAQNYADRIQILKDLTHLYAKFPAVGTGLGTHEYVYPMVDRSHNMAPATHAENEYAQILEEMGITGLALVLAFAAAVWFNYARAIRFGDPSRRLVAIGLGFGVMAVTIHSFSDFGPHIPANALLTALFCGVIVALGRSATALASEPTHDSFLRFPAGIAALAAAVLFSLWALPWANEARRSEASAKVAQKLEENLSQRNWQGDNDEYAALINAASAAADHQKDNVKYQYSLALDRWYSISRLRDDAGGIIFGPRFEENAGRILNEFLSARALCPTFGPLYSMAGQLESTYFEETAPALRHLSAAFRLAPCDPGACFAAARQEAVAGNMDESVRAFRRYLEMTGGFQDVVNVFVSYANRPDLAMDLARGHSDRLSLLATALDSKPEFQPLADQARAEAIDLLKAHCEQRNALPADLIELATHLVSKGDYPAAADCYRRALTKDYGNVNWRMALANLLLKMELPKDAEHEARICLRIRPQDEQARLLVASLSVAPRPKEE